MKRELKDDCTDWKGTTISIARPIPMKRELKGVTSYDRVNQVRVRYCKAHPDEKGTESIAI